MNIASVLDAYGQRVRKSVPINGPRFNEAQLLDLLCLARSFGVKARPQNPNDLPRYVLFLNELELTLGDPGHRTDPRLLQILNGIQPVDRQQVSDDQFDVEREADQAGVQPSEIINQPPVE